MTRSRGLTGRSTRVCVARLQRGAATPGGRRSRPNLFSHPPSSKRQVRPRLPSHGTGEIRRRGRQRCAEPGGLLDSGIGTPAHLRMGCVGARTLSNPQAKGGGETGGAKGGGARDGRCSASGVGEEPAQAGSSQRTPAPMKPAHTSSMAPALPGFRRLRVLATTLACLQVLSVRREG